MSDFRSVTETTGLAVTREALEMARARYGFCSTFVAGRDVLEIGCGSGQGLGWLSSTARFAVGGDYTMALLAQAKAHYGRRVRLARFDATRLPFATASFDVAVALEMIYYVADADEFLRECARVVRPDGALILCTINPAWRDFNPSPMSQRYFTAQSLQKALQAAGWNAELFGDFVDAPPTRTAEAISALKRFAVRQGLMPKTMKGKRLLKRVFLGPLEHVPAELAPQAPTERAPVPVTASDAPRYKVIYAVGKRRVER